MCEKCTDFEVEGVKTWRQANEEWGHRKRLSDPTDMQGRCYGLLQMEKVNSRCCIIATKAGCERVNVSSGTSLTGSIWIQDLNGLFCCLLHSLWTCPSSGQTKTFHNILNTIQSLASHLSSWIAVQCLMSQYDLQYLHLSILTDWLWSPYVIGQTIIFSCCGLFFFFLFFFLSFFLA